MRLQKKTSLPWPNGCSTLGLRCDSLMPTSRRMPLPVSTIEWIPSESIAELPVMPATTNFVTAIARFDAMAAYTAVFDSAIAR